MGALPQTRSLNGGTADADTLGPDDFARIAGLVRDAAGLSLSPIKRPMVESRLRKQARAQGLPDLRSFLARLDAGPDPEDLRIVVGALTTNITSFYREPHHFEVLRRTILPTLAAVRDRGAPVRFWSAGCSDGMEPYTLAAELDIAWGEAAATRARILATDIDAEMITAARAGRYEAGRVKGMPADRRAALLEPEQADHVTVRSVLRRRVTFNVHNLLEPWPMRHPFDVVFCRNVVIYFDDRLRLSLWPRFAAAIRPGGWLFLGHSERIVGPMLGCFRQAGTTLYQRTDTPAPGAAPNGGGGPDVPA